MPYLPLYQNEDLGSHGNFEKPRHWKINTSFTYVYQNTGWFFLEKIKNVVGRHIYVQAKSRLPGWLMDSNSNWYSPKIIWGLYEDLPDSAGLVTVKGKGTVISCLLLLWITFFFQDQKFCMCGQHISKQIQQTKNKCQNKHLTKAKPQCLVAQNWFSGRKSHWIPHFVKDYPGL